MISVLKSFSSSLTQGALLVEVFGLFELDEQIEAFTFVAGDYDVFLLLGGVGFFLTDEGPNFAVLLGVSAFFAGLKICSNSSLEISAGSRFPRLFMFLGLTASGERVSK